MPLARSRPSIWYAQNKFNQIKQFTQQKFQNNSQELWDMTFYMCAAGAFPIVCDTVHSCDSDWKCSVNKTWPLQLFSFFFLFHLKPVLANAHISPDKTTLNQQNDSFQMIQQGGVDLLLLALQREINDLYNEPKRLDEFHYVSNINGAHQDSKWI